MKTDSVFNTVFETSLRLLILLDESDVDLNVESIQAVDFMATYGKEFSIAENSANGDNPFMFCELATRKTLVESALKELVIKGYVLPTATRSGFLYRSLLAGHRLAQSLSSEYPTEYRDAVENALCAVTKEGIDSVLAAIKRKSRTALNERLAHE